MRCLYVRVTAFDLLPKYLACRFIPSLLRSVFKAKVMGGKIAYSRPWLINRYESETVNKQQPAKKIADINDRSLCFSTVEQNVSSFSSHEYSATVLIITYKCQLPPTDPRDALHHTSRVVHKGKRSFLIDWRQSLIELS